MERIKRQIMVNAKSHGLEVYAQRPLVTGDVAAYEIVMTAPYDLSGAVFTVSAKRSDGVVIADVGEIAGGKAVYTLKNNMHAVEGALEMDLQLSQDGGMLTECRLICDVCAGHGAADVTGDDRLPILTGLIAQVSLLSDACVGAASAASAAAAEAYEMAQNVQTAIQSEIGERTSADVALSASISGHTSDKDNPHGVTVGQIGAATQAALQSETDERTGADSALSDYINGHISDKDNPHEITAEKIGAATQATLQSEINARTNADAGLSDYISGHMFDANAHSNMSIVKTINNKQPNASGNITLGELPTKTIAEADSFAERGIFRVDHGYTVTNGEDYPNEPVSDTYLYIASHHSGGGDPYYNQLRLCPSSIHPVKIEARSRNHYGDWSDWSSVVGTKVYTGAGTLSATAPAVDENQNQDFNFSVSVPAGAKYVEMVLYQERGGNMRAAITPGSEQNAYWTQTISDIPGPGYIQNYAGLFNVGYPEIGYQTDWLPFNGLVLPESYMGKIKLVNNQITFSVSQFCPYGAESKTVTTKIWWKAVV